MPVSATVHPRKAARRRERTRRWLALLALPLGATFAPLSLHRPAPVPQQSRLWAEPVPLDERSPSRTTLGLLHFLGGWSLHSNDPRFGGISALHVDHAGILALSDAGFTFRFGAPGGDGPIDLVVRQLGDGPGSADNKLDRDSEAMAVGDGDFWVAFERRNAIWRYDLGTLSGQAGAAPAAMRNWPANAGSEAMVRLPDGRFLLFAERIGRADGTSEVLLFDGDPSLTGAKSVRLAYRPPSGYRITDAVCLDDGRLLFLNRRVGVLSGISAKLTLSGPLALKEGDMLTGREVATWRAPVTADNYEALAVTRENGRRILWIASDDNFMAVQRTLLLKFALD